MHFHLPISQQLTQKLQFPMKCNATVKQQRNHQNKKHIIWESQRRFFCNLNLFGILKNRKKSMLSGLGLGRSFGFCKCFWWILYAHFVQKTRKGFYGFSLCTLHFIEMTLRGKYINLLMKLRKPQSSHYWNNKTTTACFLHLQASHDDASIPETPMY